MPSSMIVVSGTEPASPTWRSNFRLRVGRLPNIEIVLDDNSVSRQHAEIVATDDGWVMRDLGSSNGTFLNNVRIGRTGQRLRTGDQLQFGHASLRVESITDAPDERIQAPGQVICVESTAVGFWDEALRESKSTDADWQSRLRAFLKLVRDVCRISHSTALTPGLQAVLNDVVTAFDAQRGGVLLMDPLSGDLIVRSMAVPKRALSARDRLSKTCALKAFEAGRFILFRDCTEDDQTREVESVRLGTMNSIICAILPSADGPSGVLHLDRGPFQQPFTQADLYLADSLAAALALGIDRWQLVEKEQDTLIQTVTALAQAVEFRDRYTGNHTHRVTTYALLLADELKIPPSERRLLQVATPLHDIGKIAVDDSVLRKPGQLTNEEFDLMKSHVASGVNIIQMVPALSWAMPVIRSHHERWDGTGYPDGLKGTEIPLTARIVAVADAFDAMTTDRPYRKGLSVDDAFNELSAKAGIHFDPNCVTAFLKARSKVEVMLGQEAILRQEANDITKTMSRRELTEILSQTLGPGDAIPLFK